ncbi:MAG: hypothetical protein ABIH23_28230, partial [bacterium]
KLVRITGNKMAIWFWQLIDPFFKWLSPTASENPISPETLQKHRHMLVALEEGDPFEFENAVRVHHLWKISYGDERYDNTAATPS